MATRLSSRRWIDHVPAVIRLKNNSKLEVMEIGPATSRLVIKVKFEMILLLLLLVLLVLLLCDTLVFSTSF